MSDQPRRREVWGDDPEEVDASAIIAEFESVESSVERRWHEHPAFVPPKVVARFIQRSGKRIAVTVAGFLLLIVAAVIIPIPGPWSILLTIIALSILATEYIWAERLLNTARRKAEQAKDIVLRKKKNGDAPST
jgi:Putative transmembrane protein (PGPGW)